MTIGVSCSSGNDATIWKPFEIARSWLLIAHADVAVDDPRRAFGVEADVVERRTGLAGRVVGAAQAVLEEVAQKLLRARAVRTGDVRPADARRRQRALQAVGGVVVELAGIPPACRCQ